MALKANFSISYKQFAAGLLLVLFAFIHGVKCFHHHSESSLLAKRSFAKKVVTSNIPCSICDYHFIKDADAVTAFATLQPLLIHLSARFYYILPATTSIGLPGTDRGPPALV